MTSKSNHSIWYKKDFRDRLPEETLQEYYDNSLNDIGITTYSEVLNRAKTFNLEDFYKKQDSHFVQKYPKVLYKSEIPNKENKTYLLKSETLTVSSRPICTIINIEQSQVRISKCKTEGCPMRSHSNAFKNFGDYYCCGICQKEGKNHGDRCERLCICGKSYHKSHFC